ncbi:hypothetical protein JQX13_02350 [Archangium violaceum]|uniref:hypothetical protein n=1 Tax=Archangium violaceum TaxID=83451 RepID=UPI00193B1FE6|nr:hypothetical protein [Archangium violaceum]QRK09028.1 hypothetical protein JQX13_02350 [Archangium violaceum]
MTGAGAASSSALASRQRGVGLTNSTRPISAASSRKTHWDAVLLDPIHYRGNPLGLELVNGKRLV